MKFRDHAILFLILMAAVCNACKEDPPIYARRIKAIDRHDTSSPAALDRLADLTSSETMPAPKAAVQKDTRTVHIAIPRSEQDSIVSFDERKRTPLSDFDSDNEKKTVSVSMIIRGVHRSQTEAVESRIFDMLAAHAPHPYELRRKSAIDKDEKVWGTLTVNYKYQTRRLRRTSKTAPLRADYSFSYAMALKTAGNSRASWDGFQFHWGDANSAVGDAAAAANFWKKLDIPSLTANVPDDTNQWLRAQGLMPNIENLNSIKLPMHKYYSSGCIVSDESAPGASKQQSTVRFLNAPYNPPRYLAVSPITIQCRGKSVFVLTRESSSKVALYYHPPGAVQAWKSLFSFRDDIKPHSANLHINDDLICIYTGTNETAHSSEIQCISRKTGLSQWVSDPIPGSLRAFADTNHQFILITDQAALRIQQSGALEKIIPIKTSGRSDINMSCMAANRMVFMTAPGHFAAWNIQNDTFDWQTAVMNPQGLFCTPHNLILISDVGGYLFAFDIENNAPKWKYRTVDAPRDIITYGGHIYILLDQAIYVLDYNSGHLRHQIPLPWSASRFISLGQRIYIDTKEAVYTWK